MAGAGALLLDHEQQGVAVAVVVGGPHPLAVAGGVALAPALLAASGPEHGAAGLERLGQRRPAFIHPIISTAPLDCSCTMAGNQPVGVVADLGQLLGGGVDGRGDRHAFMVGTRARRLGVRRTDPAGRRHRPGASRRRAYRYSPVPSSTRSEATAWMSRSRRIR